MVELTGPVAIYRLADRPAAAHEIPLMLTVGPMAKKEIKGVEDYKGAAAGWGALKAVADALRGQWPSSTKPMAC